MMTNKNGLASSILVVICWNHDTTEFSLSCNLFCCMRRNNQLSDVLHILLHLMDAEEPMTSAQIGKMLETNPVVVRRTMAGLRDAGLVSSEKGHGGGWTISCEPQTTTLADVYAALGSPPIFSFGNRSDNPQCLVELCVQESLGIELKKAEAMMLKSFKRLKLSQLSREFSNRMKDFVAVPSDQDDRIRWVHRSKRTR